MDKIKMLIIILCCILVIILLSNLVIRSNIKEEIDKNEEDGGAGEISVELKKQQSPDIYFAVESYLQVYFSQLAQKNSEEAYYLLHKDYIDINGITIDNVLEKSIQIVDYKNFDVNEMYVIEGEGEYSNYIKGTLMYQEQKYIWYGLVEINNFSLAIYPFSEQDYYDIIEGNKSIERKKIEINDYNEFFSPTFSKEELCYKYFEDYVDKLLYNPKEAYNLLDNEYKEKRFKNNEELFNEYLEERKRQIEESVMTSYSFKYNGYDIEYIVIKDNFDNYYIIKENAVLDYTIQLDNYTIKTDEYYQEYTKLEDSKKVANNLKECIRMLNNKDYSHLYDKLYEEFKTTNFPDETTFKEYMKNTYFDYNILNVKSVTHENGNIYVCKANVKDGVSSAAETKDFTVIMNLIDNNDYVISFTIEQSE